MKTRRDTLIATSLGVVATLSGMQPAQAQTSIGCPSSDSAAAAFALHDRYVAAANTGDTDDFPAIFAADYIQHSGRSPSGLAAQIANARALHVVFPDMRLRVEDRIFGDGKLVARNVFSGSQRAKFRGFEPTGKVVKIRTIDIWRIAEGKLAEHWDIVDFADVDKQLRGD
jgi:predicted ester cyclase